MQPEDALRARRSEVPSTQVEPELAAPRGTLAILLVYMLVIIGLWGYTYVSLILRS
ncbi:hypothetical protein [Limnochorda pilosa]|uniref:Cytochrome c oxidase subunit 2A n=1 Tax=Limnochorda pilosa TaxID=1555112 RepID=A0A0K2SL24_LIMPI|nr:hypothetical protein [Limnochorda pilosa]BAS27800.1 hypothetical protein LIP_1959 [Limnochorda pilosa]